MKKSLCILLALLLTLSVLAALAEPAPAADRAVIPDLEPEVNEIPDNEALAFMRSLGVGWNLGNTFDAYRDNAFGNKMNIEKSWVGVLTTREMIQAVADAGFGVMRLPVSWHNHLGADFAIDEEWLSRVQEVADWALDAGMCVIVNIHHDNSKLYFYPDKEHEERSLHYIHRIWEQVAERFRDYDDRLLMESMNEPRMVGTEHEWWLDLKSSKCRESVEVINALNQEFVNTVRASGGNNATRYLVVPGYDASPDGVLTELFTLPQDTVENRLVVATHAYVPYNFALQQPGTDKFSLSSSRSTSPIRNPLRNLYRRFVSKGIPVIMDEFGCLNKNGNLQARVDCAAYYTATAASVGIPVVWWDNNLIEGEGEQFGLYYRQTGEWIYPEIVEAMMRYKMKAE